MTVLCLPAQSEADEIVGLMLAQLLEFKGQRAIAAPQASLVNEMVELVAQHGATVVCISALPPAALTRSRYLCKRLSARFPELPVVVALWTSKADPKRFRDRLASDGPVKLATTLAGATAEIHNMVQPVLRERALAAANEDAKTEALALVAG